MNHFVYILRCNDASYYIGQATNVEERVERHNAGRGCQFTRARRPVVLAYQEGFATKEEATRRERQLKTWSRPKKEALIHNNMRELVNLSHGGGARRSGSSRPEEGPIKISNGA
jgi:putative endonuclease